MVLLKKWCTFIASIMVVFLLSSCINSNQFDGTTNDVLSPVAELEQQENETNNNDQLIDTEDSEVVEEKPTEEELITAEIEKMTLEEKIGQLIIGGFAGTTMTEEVKQLIHTYKLGGYILFAHNLETPDQSLSLLNSLKEENEKYDIPLFISVDQEGGKVTRLPGLNN